MSLERGQKWSEDRELGDIITHVLTEAMGVGEITQ